MNRSTEKQSLEGVTAVWTGSADAAKELLEALEEQGAVVEISPLIEFGPPTDPEHVRVALRNLSGFSWILFTSAQGAKSFDGVPSPSSRVAAVGPGTEAAVKKLGWRVDLVPERHDALGLAAALEKAEPERTAGPILFVRGDRAGRELPETLGLKGFQVEELEVYSTRLVDSNRAAQIAGRIAQVADVVIMGSPSGVLALSRAVAPRSLNEIKPGLRWVCLGQATNAALVEAGVTDAAFPEKIRSRQFVQTVLKVLKN